MQYISGEIASYLTRIVYQIKKVNIDVPEKWINQNLASFSESHIHFISALTTRLLVEEQRSNNNNNCNSDKTKKFK